MDIIIKSFNRAYYLERCLYSIYKNVKGDYNITIIDDGTPKKYLDKIKKNYPSVKIILSNNYEKKSKKLENKKDVNGFQIPTNHWINAVKEVNDYVLIIEDDVWFTKSLNINNIIGDMKENNVDLVKLGWLGIKDNLDVDEQNISSNLLSTYPKNLFTSNKIIMDLFFYNKLKFFTILYKLGIVNNHTRDKYWTLNSILMGLYRKDYWLYIWKDAKGKVDELQQLRNASVWFGKNKKNKNLIAKTNEEVLKTTFSSSATNSYHKYEIEIDINRVNRLLNEAWLNDNFNITENFPKDFSQGYITSFLDDNDLIENWKKWTEKFKSQYRNVGAIVD